LDKTQGHKMKRKFKHIKRELLEDKELMLKGMDSYGTYFAMMGQTVALGAPVLFDSHDLMHYQDHTLGTGAITVKKDGVYSFFFLTECTTASQFSIAVNGIPDLTTTAGCNKGASIVFLRQVLELKAGDVITVINHLSSVGSVFITQSPGGSAKGVSAVLNLKKIAPPLKCIKDVPLECWKNRNIECERKCDCECDCKCKKPKLCRKDKVYKMFKNFLLRQRCLDIDGAEVILHAGNTVVQQLAAEKAMPIGPNQIIKKACHTPGKPEFRVGKSGIYQLIFDSETIQPAQFAAFNKDTVLESTITGTNSGANEITMTQLIKLEHENVMTIKNHTSFSPIVQTQLNPGGVEVAENTTLTLYRIAPCKKEHEKKCVETINKK